MLFSFVYRNGYYFTKFYSTIHTTQCKIIVCMCACCLCCHVFNHLIANIYYYIYDDTILMLMCWRRPLCVLETFQSISIRIRIKQSMMILMNAVLCSVYFCYAISHKFDSLLWFECSCSFCLVRFKYDFAFSMCPLSHPY